MCKRLNRLVSQSSIKPRLMRFDNGKQNRAAGNGRYWCRSPFNHDRRVAAEIPKPKTQTPKNLQNPNLKNRHKLFGYLELEISLGFGTWDLNFPPQKRRLVSEVAEAGENHRHVAFISRGNDFLVAN